MKNFNLTLIVQDFIGTTFQNNDTCGGFVIEKAVMRRFPEINKKNIEECVFSLYICNNRYKHKPYRFEDFNKDMEKAKKITDLNAKVRTIRMKLYKIKNIL